VETIQVVLNVLDQHLKRNWFVPSMGFLLAKRTDQPTVLTLVPQAEQVHRFGLVELAREGELHRYAVDIHDMLCNLTRTVTDVATG